MIRQLRKFAFECDGIHPTKRTSCPCSFEKEAYTQDEAIEYALSIGWTQAPAGWLCNAGDGHLTNGEWRYVEETDDYQIGIRREGNRWRASFYHKRGGWGRTSSYSVIENESINEAARRIAMRDLACPLS